MSNEKLARSISHDTPSETIASVERLSTTAANSKTSHESTKQRSPDELEKKWLEIIGRLFNPLG